MLDIIDTHAHLDMNPLSRDKAGAVQRAGRAGVSQIMTIGIDLASSRRAVGIAESFQEVYASVGIHPHDAKGATDGLYERLRGLAAHPKVVAWGEIGLDFAKEYSPRAVQRDVFLRQLELAREEGLPVVIHDREAHGELLEMLAEAAGPGLSGVVHCFSGDTALAAAVLDLGFYISVTGVVTFPKAEMLRDVVSYVPLDRLLLETDSPFLAPVPRRGKPNEPAYVVHVAEKVSELKNIPIEEVARCTSANARALFKLPAI